jgi:hypothetical protein
VLGVLFRLILIEQTHDLPDQHGVAAVAQVLYFTLSSAKFLILTA